jgi:hypothetical protein
MEAWYILQGLGSEDGVWFKYLSGYVYKSTYSLLTTSRTLLLIFLSLSHCNPMVGYVWRRHTYALEATTKDFLSMFFIKWMWKKLEYLCFDTHKGAQPVVIQETTQVGLCQL